MTRTFHLALRGTQWNPAENQKCQLYLHSASDARWCENASLQPKTNGVFIRGEGRAGTHLQHFLISHLSQALLKRRLMFAELPRGFTRCISHGDGCEFSLDISSVSAASYLILQQAYKLPQQQAQAKYIYFQYQGEWYGYLSCSPLAVLKLSNQNI